MFTTPTGNVRLKYQGVKQGTKAFGHVVYQ